MTYTIDDGMIFINGHKEKILCRCGYILGEKNNRGAIMLKSKVVVFDLNSKTIVAKCDQCKAVVTLDVENPGTHGQISM